MKRQLNRGLRPGFLLVLTLSLTAALVALVVYLSAAHAGNNLHSFSESVLSLAEGWTLTDGAGEARAVDFPETVEYGVDGRYTLTRALPGGDALITSPVLRFYSNYVDVRVYLDDRELYAYPNAPAAFCGATGNTYHYVRLPADYAGRTLRVELRCQLGRGITYLLNPPLIGSKATMLKQDIMKSLPAFMLSGCVGMLALGLGALYFAFRRRLNLSASTLYTALFALLFAVYLSFETSFAQILMPNGYMLCFATLMLLALAPIPLMGIFLESVSRRLRPAMYALMLLCAANFLAQIALNFCGASSVRTMLPATHVVILFSIAVASVCLFFSDRGEKPGARRALISAVPMIVGGITDIVLLNLNRPSPNNCFWFAIGVTIFIVHQLCGFVQRYFTLYRASVESQLLTDMAYRDELAGIDNRNAYERKLKALSDRAPSDRLGCIVMDINDLKLINDTLGHQAGDAAIAAVGAILRECAPAEAACFRTGGDEFVVLLDGCDAQRTRLLAETLAHEAQRRGELSEIPICLAVGYGQYADADGDVLGFIRRIDTRMYACKRSQKNGARGREEPRG